MSKHISFSALKMWKECPFKYKLSYVDNLGKFVGNEYTAFGTALHEACEKKLLNESEDEATIFSSTFEKELDTIFANKSKNEDLISEMKQQGKMLAPLALPALKEFFGNFTILAAEEEIYEKMPDENEWNFKGFIDLIIKTDDGKIHILDWKSCAWGWDIDKRNNPMTTYQLMYYKHFYAKKYNINPELVETYFALLKRTAKENNVEIFRVTSGDKRMQNAFSLLGKALLFIDKAYYPKNRLACKYCEFSKTKECP